MNLRQKKQKKILGSLSGVGEEGTPVSRFDFGDGAWPPAMGLSGHPPDILGRHLLRFERGLAQARQRRPAW